MVGVFNELAGSYHLLASTSLSYALPIQGSCRPTSQVKRRLAVRFGAGLHATFPTYVVSSFGNPNLDLIDGFLRKAARRWKTTVLLAIKCV